MVDKVSPLANISSRSKRHSLSQIRCVHTKQSSPGRPSFSSARQTEPKNIQISFDRYRCGQLFQRSRTLDLERLLKSRAFSAKIYTVGLLLWPELLQRTWGTSSWELSPKRWKNTKQTFAVGAKRFTRTRRSWKDSSPPLLSACLDTSTLS